MIWSILSRSPCRSRPVGVAARTGPGKRVASNAAPPVAATDLRKRRRLCLRIVIVVPQIAARSPRRGCARLGEYHAFVTVVRKARSIVPFGASPESALQLQAG